MKLFLNALVFTVIMAIIYALSYLGPAWIGLGRFNSSRTIGVIRVLLACTWLAGITYNILWHKHTIQKKRTYILFVFLFVCSLLVSWTIHASYILADVYKSIKQPSRGWRNNPHQFDSLLGFKPVPNANGFHTFPTGHDIPMHYDENGFRVPMSYDHSQNQDHHPRILFLGCSFTYGDANFAEETFPYLVEKELNGYTINAGVCSYGLSQMLELSQTLIPKYKPDVVIFQHSPWLVERALNQYGPVYFSVLPTPYFDSQNHLVPPLFRSHIFDYPMDDFKQSKNGFRDYLRFMRITFPMYFEDDMRMWLIAFKKMFSLVPKPNQNEQATEQFVMHEVHEICKQNNCRLFTLALSTTRLSRANYPPDKAEGIPEINADSCLYARLTPGETYEKKYFHYRMSGKDSVMVDTHPNETAQKIIAGEIVHVLKNTGAIKQ
ncbi:MAG: hypothetical protein NT126_08025 [Bacteroidetes bacterium]|nr:hypothetical protein [Bacteroidota bacterium]